MKYQRLRGVKDTFAPESGAWERVIAAALHAMDNYGYKLIITPVIEEKALFCRGIGEGSDIVMKEMYDFKDKKGRDIVLRPEGTASVVRAFIENSLPQKSDLWYIGPMFRYEKPQKGRNREFYQIGVESFGDASFYKDAEVIKLAADILKNAGIKAGVLNINMLNCRECGPVYVKALKEYLEKNKGKLCETCVQKTERVPVRVLDCKAEPCKEAVKNAPKPADYLCDKCKSHYTEAKKLLTSAGVSFMENPLLVRGLDYYTGLVFEFITDKLGPQQNTVLAGGRYDNLVHELGGKETPATGFAMGIDRIVEVLAAEGTAAVEAVLDAFIVTDAQYLSEAFSLLNTLRENNVKAAMSFEGKSFKSQFREADSRKARFVIVIGETEIKNGTVSLKNMSSGEQKEIKIEDVIKMIK